MNTTYIYDETGHNITFNLASSITITLQPAKRIMFSLLNGFFLRGASSGTLPGADNQSSFITTNDLISGNFTIMSNKDSTHNVTFDSNGNNTIAVQQFNINIGNGSVILQNGITINASQNIDIITSGNIRIEDVIPNSDSTQKLIAQSGILLSANVEGIYVGDETTIETVNGQIILKGYGINIINSTIKNTNGSITLDGTDVKSNRPNCNVAISSSTIEGNGVNIIGNSGPTYDAGAIISVGVSTIDGGTDLVSLTGIGDSDIAYSSYGVRIQFSGIKGNGVSIMGNNITGNNEVDEIDILSNIGILFTDGFLDAGEGTVTLIGTGNGNYSSSGVVIQNTSQSQGVMTIKGKGVTITGSGGTSATSERNMGIFIYGNCTIDAGADLVNLTGTGGSGTSYNMGVSLVDSTVKGKSVTITGNGGTNATGNENHGVDVFHGTITSNEGNVQVNGYSGGSGKNSNTNYGIHVTSGGKITAGSMGTVTVFGNSNDKNRIDIGNSSNYGIVVSGVSTSDSVTSTITSSGGKVMVTGTGRGVGSYNSGVLVEKGGVITSGGSGEVVVNGTGSIVGKGNYNYGVSVSESSISSSGGNVTVNGYSGGTGLLSKYNYGLNVTSGKITAGMMGTVTVVGNDIARRDTVGADYNHGVFVSGRAGVITSSGGKVTVDGTGIGTGKNGFGVQISSGKITATGNGKVEVTGTGNIMGSGINHGVLVSGGGAIEGSAPSGSVMVIGTGGGTRDSSTNFGVQIGEKSQIVSTGIGEVVVKGTSTNGTNGIGVYVTRADAKITSTMGKISVTGTGNGVGKSIGVFCGDGGQIISTEKGEVIVIGAGKNK